MKKPLFQKVAILGLGLIGGSIALELKQRRLAGTVTGYNRSAKSRRIALKRKACDEVTADPNKAVQGADLVILATPVRNIPALAQQIAPDLKPGAVVTDVGSTKQALVQSTRRVLPKKVCFIGGHPIAGTEQTGMESAASGLFQDRWWILTPGPSLSASHPSLQKLLRMIRSMGARPAKMSPQQHDEILGAVSHLPHLVAYSLVHAVVDFHQGRPLKWAGRSFRDVTRIAASSASMWTDICLDNRRVLLDLMKKYEKIWQGLRRALVAKNPARLRRFFERAARVRSRL